MSVVAGLPKHFDTLIPASAEQRFSVYRDAICTSHELGKTGQASYYLANLALEELVVRTNGGEEPTENSIALLEHRFDLAADINKNDDKFLELRSKLLRAWIRPIVWSGVINIEGLSTNEARKVSHAIQLPQATDTTAWIAANAVQEFDELDKMPAEQRNKDESQEYKYLVGFINEVTPILLGARYNTAKQFALPSTAYDDDINPDVSVHLNGFYYDNRRTRPGMSRYPYHVTSYMPHRHVKASIPEVNARMLGNLTKSSRWPNDDRQFATTRRLITERRGKKLSSEATSTLSSIGSAVFNIITRQQQK
jgi:hypothetical protein